MYHNTWKSIKFLHYSNIYIIYTLKICIIKKKRKYYSLYVIKTFLCWCELDAAFYTNDIYVYNMHHLGCT